MSELSDLIGRANRDREWSTRAIAKKARAAGFSVSHATVGKVLNGTHGRIDIDTVLALEHVFNIPSKRITDAAGVPPVGEPYRPPTEARQLSTRQRKAVSELILAIVKDQPEASVTRLPGPLDEALDSLPSEDEEAPPISGRSLPDAARREDREVT